MRLSILVLVALVMWMSARIIDLENYRHASFVGMCAGPDFIERDRCLQSTQTRTHWIWHLAYGLKIF